MAIPPEAVGHYQPDIVSAEFPYWAKMATWTVAEAAAVLVGVNPYVAAIEGGRLEREWKRYAKDYYGVLTLAHKALDQNEVEYPETPANWLDWAKKRDLPIFRALEKEVDRWRTFKSPSVAAEQQALIDQLKAENARLEGDLGKAKSASELSPGARERESMLKLIIGMAIQGYRYDAKAKRSETIREIAKDLEKTGVTLSDDTVRKYLAEAATLVPPQEKP